MQGISCNPYLPLDEYVPDGEPRIFDNRLYVYGSHDRTGGDFFCLEDYVVWSAPLDDLSDWRCDGISYRRDQDPHNADGKWELFAPDVVQGTDGKYYLYYCLRMQREFGVAVSDSPTGPFAFYAHITRADGSVYDAYMPYDPAVLVDDDGRVYLYYGYTSESIAAKFGAVVSKGCMVLELESDMRTVKAGPFVCLPKDVHTAGTGFEEHGYYEGPSIRKINDLYYLVYSSEKCHELCYAVSSHPTSGFSYGGVLVSNGDIGIDGRTDPVCMPGNNHGGLVCVNGQYYIFYQRHTQCTQYSRQGCAEPVVLLPDGSIRQVEVTTGGLNCGPLPAKGTWSAALACVLTHPDKNGMLDYRNADPEYFPGIWQSDTADGSHEHYIRNITDGVVFGFRYFKAENIRTIALTLRGTATGVFEFHLDSLDASPLSSLTLDASNIVWTTLSTEVSWSGTNALYVVYKGSGQIDVKELIFK